MRKEHDQNEPIAANDDLELHLDEEAIRRLRQFFNTLDRWDREAQERGVEYECLARCCTRFRERSRDPKPPPARESLQEVEDKELIAAQVSSLALK